MSQAARDENFVTTLLAASNADGTTPVKVYADPVTHRLLVDIPGTTGTVTSVSVVTANGFAGSVADPTSTPAITLSTTVTGIVKGNGTAISAASAGTDYVAPGAITSSGLTQATNKLLGRSTALTGAIEEITVGSGLSLAAGTLTATGGGTGDVVGPASATDNAVARFDTTTGKLIQNSSLLIDDSGNVTGPAAGFKITGGTGTTADLTLQTTSGVGATGADMHFLVGNNGATEAMTILNSGLVGIGTTTPGSALQVNSATQPFITVGGIVDGTTKYAFAEADFALVNPAAATPQQGLWGMGAEGIYNDAGVLSNENFYFYNVNTSKYNILINGASDIGLGGTTMPGGGVLTGAAIYIDHTDKVGIGTTSPTARLHLPAGTATADTAPLKFTAGTNLSAAAAGAMEWDGTNLFITQTTGPTRKTIAYTTDITAASLTIGSTTIASGTNTRILYDNSGTLGEYTITGSGTVVAMATAPTFVTSITTPSVLATANDSGALGASGTAFADLFLASGGVINWNAGNYTLTHSAGILAANSDFRITSANVGTNADSVPTLSSTSTLTNKTLTSPAVTTATFTGAQVLAENASIQLDPAGSADGKYTGITVTATGGATIAFGDLLYLDAATSRWKLADADAAATAGPVAIAMAATSSTDGNPVTLLLQGIIRADAKFPTMTVGATQYVGETSGAIQGTIPTGADNIIRTVGYALTADELYFAPSTDWQVTVA